GRAGSAVAFPASRPCSNWSSCGWRTCFSSSFPRPRWRAPTSAPISSNSSTRRSDNRPPPRDLSSPVESGSPTRATPIHAAPFELGSYLGQQFQDDRPELCGPGCTHEQFDFNAEAYENALDAATGVTTYVNHGLLLSGFGDNQDFLASADYHTLGNLTAADGVN